MKGSVADPAEQVQVINLEHGSADRLARFRQRNSHLRNVTRISAIDGLAVDRARLVENGTIAEDCPYLPGSLGCALSHLDLWKQAASLERVVTVMEDDVICSRQFDSESARVRSMLPPDWDIILWGYLFFAIVYVA